MQFVDFPAMCKLRLEIRTHAKRDNYPFRAMLTHPIDDEASSFYTRFGFIASPLSEQQLLLLLKDARLSLT